AGTDARTHRPHLGPVFWLRVRDGRPGRGGTRAAGRRDEHCLRLQGLRVSSADRAADGISARSGQTRVCMTRWTAAAAIVAAASCVAVLAQSARPAATLFDGARLVIGDGRTIENGAVLVEGNTITRVGAKGD